MGFCCSMSLAYAQEPLRSYQDSHHNVIASIRNDATLFDKDNAFLGQFKTINGAEVILNSQNKIIGYIQLGPNKSQEIVDAAHKTIGFIKGYQPDYSTIIEDASHNTLGVIKTGGIVENKDHAVIGYVIQSEPMWAGIYFFLLKFK